MRFISTTLLLAGLAITGCKSSVQPLRTPDQANKQFHQAVAQQCQSHYPAGVSPADLNTQTKKWFTTLDEPAQDLYRRSIATSCATDPTQPDCYNTGVLRAIIQDGTMNKFVTQVCGPAPK